LVSSTSMTPGKNSYQSAITATPTGTLNISI